MFETTFSRWTFVGKRYLRSYWQLKKFTTSCYNTRKDCRTLFNSPVDLSGHQLRRLSEPPSPHSSTQSQSTHSPITYLITNHKPHSLTHQTYHHRLTRQSKSSSPHSPMTNPITIDSLASPNHHHLTRQWQTLSPSTHSPVQIIITSLANHKPHRCALNSVSTVNSSLTNGV